MSQDDPFDLAPIGYLTTDAQWSVTQVNRTLLEWLGVEKDDVLGRHLAELLTTAGRIYHETHYAPLVMHRGRAQEIAADMRRPGHDPLPVLLSSRALPDEGPYTSIRTSVVRVEERRRYEDELLAQRRRAEASEQRTATLLAGISDLVAADTLEAVSAALARAGASIPGIATSTIWMLEAGGTGLREYGTGGASQRLLPITAEHPVTACAGSGKPVVDERLGMIAAPLGDPAAPNGVLLVAAPDLVDVPQPDRDLVFSLAAQAGQALDRARMHERRDAIQKSAGRDVMGPLQTVLGHAMSLRELLDERLSAAERDAIDRLIQNAERIQRLVEGFLELSAVEDDPSRVRRTTLRLSDVIDDAVRTMAPVADGRGVALDVSNTADRVTLEADAHLLTLAVVHLLEDAIIHSPRNGRVGVTVVADTGHVNISIRDDGVGERLPQEAWVQVTSDDEEGRSALGQAISEGIILAHGGHLVLDEGPGGAWASAVLPLAGVQSSAATTS